MVLIGLGFALDYGFRLGYGFRSRCALRLCEKRTPDPSYQRRLQLWSTKLGTGPDMADQLVEILVFIRGERSRVRQTIQE